jgi:DNA-binding beta-propeller fold protein YncE
VLIVSSSTNSTRRLTIDSNGNLTDTGEILVSSSPLNVHGAPGATSGFVVSFSNNVQSFMLPRLTPVDRRTLSGLWGGASGLVHPAGDRIYVRSSDGPVDVFTYNSVTGALGSTPLLSFPTASTSPFYGIHQMAITPDGNKLYVPQPHALAVYDASTGHVLTSITHPAIVQPTGVCFAASRFP